MKSFFKVTDLEQVLQLAESVEPVPPETIPLIDAGGRVMAESLTAADDLPSYARSTMDGYAVRGADSFGASEANPAYFRVVGSIGMGETPTMNLGAGEAARISTGGMLPRGADAVVMIEYTDPIDGETLEVYRSAAPGQHVVRPGEDFKRGERLVPRGCRLRPQELGLLSAFGHGRVPVFRRPVVGIISSGDEVVPIDRQPEGAQIRDINTYTLAGYVAASGGTPVAYGIVGDDFDDLRQTVVRAMTDSDMVIVSGGSSVGARDLTIEVLGSLPDTRVLVHGISISPGKPTILARSGRKLVWGLPGHVVSAMVVYHAVVRPFVDRLGGLRDNSRERWRFRARLTRNIASAQGRTDYVRVRLRSRDGRLVAEPILGKSALINTMVAADGLIAVGKDQEGLDKGAEVTVMPI